MATLNTKGLKLGLGFDDAPYAIGPVTETAARNDAPVTNGNNGNDVVQGNTTAHGNNGNDTIVHTGLATASTYKYDGGNGYDTLQINITGLQWWNDAIRAELLRIQDAIARQDNWVNSTMFGFEAHKFEALTVKAGDLVYNTIPVLPPAALTLTGLAALKEGNADSHALYTIGLNRPMDHDVTVTYRVTGITADATDVGVGTYTAVIPAGTLSTGIDVLVRGDTKFEADETYMVSLVAGEIAVDNGEVTTVLLNDDSNVSLFTVNNDVLNFNALTAAQKTQLAAVVAAMNANDGLHTAMAGNDTVDLPDTLAVANAVSYKTNIAFEAGAGDDRISGGDYVSDTIMGGDGNDWVYGGAGNYADTLYGDAGNDRVEGSAANDKLYGGDGNDLMYGGTNGNDYMEGNAGNDTLYGQRGNDVMDGGTGNDTMIGDVGNDTMIGGAGNDWLNAGNDFDVLLGGAGDDWMNGQNQNDTLNGGAGNDTLYGGTGNDTFIVDFSGRTGEMDRIYGGDIGSANDAGFSDTLRLNFAASSEFMQYLDSIQSMMHGVAAAPGGAFESSMLGLTIQGVENVEVYVADQMVNPDAAYSVTEPATLDNPVDPNMFG